MSDLKARTVEEMIEMCGIARATSHLPWGHPDKVSVVPTNKFMIELCERLVALEELTAPLHRYNRERVS